MKLPNAEQALVEMEKLTEYALNPEHPSGRHKARVFAAALGLTRDDAPFLRQTLLEKARTEEAQEESPTHYGRRYVIDFQLTTVHGSATVRSAWMVRHNEDFPRLTSCYVL